MFEETCSHFPGLLLLLLLSIPSALCKVCTFFSGFQSDYNTSAVLTGVILWGYLGGCWVFVFFGGVFFSFRVPAFGVPAFLKHARAI